jgi:hypothetical protein
MSGGGGGVPYTGATANVDLGEYGLSGGFIEFDTTPTGTPTTQGTMWWDVDHNTAQLVMNGTTGRLLQDVFYIVKNQTGSTIPKGTVVMSAGTLGASGRILIQPFLADGTYPSEYVMGVTAEAIANGADGMVVHFGQIRNVNTSSFADGDILYASSTTAGAFTTTSPTAPNNIVLMAIVVHAASNGTLQVRPTIGSNINKDEGVVISSVANDDVLKYNSTTSLWENSNVLSTKQDTITGAATTITSSNLTNYRALVSDGGGKVAVAATTSNEIGYLSGVTSNIQTQLDGKTSVSRSFMGVIHGSNIVASGTVYATFIYPTFATENTRIFVVPYACTMSNFYVRIFTAQPASGSLVFTVRKNGADTAIVTTIAAGSASSTESNSGALSATFAQGDNVSIKIVNNATATSATVHNTSIMVEI